MALEYPRAARAVENAIGSKRISIEQFAEGAQIDPGTLRDFINGIRQPQVRTIGAIEIGLGWEPGTIKAIARGEIVGPRVEGAPTDELRYQRPPDMSDSDWERLKARALQTIEWELDRAAEER